MNDQLSHLLELGHKAGALSGKLSGAGSGGVALFVCHPRRGSGAGSQDEAVRSERGDGRMSASFQEIQDKYLPLVEKRLEEFFARAAESGIGWNSEMSRYHFSTGGKRLRALIPCWVYSAYGKNPADAIDLGCAIEMIHNATLVHDDLQDGDTVRRGKPTVWKKFSEAQAINCGDAMFQFAFQILCELNLDPSVFRKIAAQNHSRHSWK